VLKTIARGLPLALALGLASCATKPSPHLLKISVPDQKMLVFEHGTEIARYDVSTSKFGLGDRPGSYATPLGKMQVAQKIGGGQPIGMKFKSRRPTGEIVPVNAPGRDPIVTRILWLRGLEGQNRRAYGRGIYIHGTAEEWRIGTPASYGCIRMRSRDVISLYNKIGVGAKVEVTTNRFPSALVQGPGDPSPVQKLTMTPKPTATVAPAGQAPPPPTATPIPAVSNTARAQRRG
jgi:hypothetical protein